MASVSTGQSSARTVETELLAGVAGYHSRERMVLVEELLLSWLRGQHFAFTRIVPEAKQATELPSSTFGIATPPPTVLTFDFTAVKRKNLRHIPGCQWLENLY